MRRSVIESSSFVVAVVLVTAALVWLLLPYYGGVLWAVIFAILFQPLYRWLLTQLRGRRNLAAALCLLFCIVMVVIPGAIILDSLLQEATALFARAETLEFDTTAVVRAVWDGLPTFVIRMLSWVDLGGLEQFQAKITGFIGAITETAAGITVQFGQSTLQLAINLGIMLYTLFFLFRDGPALVGTIRRASPLSEHYTEQVLTKFTSVVKATVKGNVMIALLQGGLGGLIFWILGIKAALLWGVLMALLSLLPAVGATLVWVPVAAYLLISGDTTKGVILLAFGTLVIGLVDNLLRPLLVGKDLKLPDFVILISTVGGLTLIGVNGFVVGPMIAALFVAVWSLFAEIQAPD